MKKILLIISAISLNACMTQAPAPVVSGKSGYSNGYSSQAALPPNSLVKVTQIPRKSVQDSPVSHYIKPGDSLYSISRQYNVTVADIVSLNKLDKSLPLRAGHVLMIPQTQADKEAIAAQQLAAPIEDKVNATPSYSLTHKYVKKAQESTTVTPSSVVDKLKAQAVEKEEKLTYLTHIVRRGENLYRIGLKYDVSPLDLMTTNNIDRPQDLRVGQRIKVPVVTSSAEKIKAVNQTLAKAKGFVWPARGTVISRYGQQKAHGVTNTGINILLPEESPIVVADSGTVIYSDSGLESYGNLILVRHSRGIVTAYAHNSKNMVKRGERVEKGQVIALAGSTGNVDRTQLHFEVRRNARAINPIGILPKN